MAAVESTWEAFQRLHTISEWESYHLKIQQLEDEISTLSGEARELHSRAEVARDRRSAVEAKQAANKEKMTQLQ